MGTAIRGGGGGGGGSVHPISVLELTKEGKKGSGRERGMVQSCRVLPVRNEHCRPKHKEARIARIVYRTLDLCAIIVGEANPLRCRTVPVITMSHR